MTANTVLQIGNAFCAMQGDDLRRLVRMAPITGAAHIIAANVAGRAGRLVMAIKLEIAVMIKIRRLPTRRAVTHGAGQVFAIVQAVARGRVARLAIGPPVSLYQAVVEFH
jgi:hypothetical protein